MTPAERVANSNIKQLKSAARTPRVRALFSSTKRGHLNPMKRAEVAEKVSATMRSKWRPFFSNQLKRAWADGKMPHPSETGPTRALPNKAEVTLSALLQEHAPTFRYVGNRAFWVGPCQSGARKNPDFVSTSTKQVILLHGEYWHTKAAADSERLDYESRGWSVLIIWSQELRMRHRHVLLSKISSFTTPRSSPSDSSGSQPSTT